MRHRMGKRELFLKEHFSIEKLIKQGKKGLFKPISSEGYPQCSVCIGIDY
jgi:hypothetical protein